MRKSLIKSIEKKLNLLTIDLANSHMLFNEDDPRAERGQRLFETILEKIDVIIKEDLQELKDFSESKGFLVQKKN